MWPRRCRRCPRRCRPGPARCCPLPPSWLAAPRPACQPGITAMARAPPRCCRRRCFWRRAKAWLSFRLEATRDFRLPRGGSASGLDHKRDRAPFTEIVAEALPCSPSHRDWGAQCAVLPRVGPSFLPFFPSVLLAPAARAGIGSSLSCISSSGSFSCLPNSRLPNLISELLKSWTAPDRRAQAVTFSKTTPASQDSDLCS